MGKEDLLSLLDEMESEEERRNTNSWRGAQNIIGGAKSHLPLFPHWSKSVPRLDLSIP